MRTRRGCAVAVVLVWIGGCAGEDPAQVQAGRHAASAPATPDDGEGDDLIIQAPVPAGGVVINAPTMVPSPSNDISIRTVTFSGPKLIARKAVKKTGTSCAGVSFFGAPEQAISIPFSFTPSINQSNLVCAIGKNAAGQWQSTPSASPVLVIDTYPPPPVAIQGLGPSPSNDTSARTVTIAGDVVAYKIATVPSATA